MLASGVANATLAQHFVLGVFADLICPFRWPTRKAFVLRTDAAFAAPGLPNLWWCRNAGFRASKRCAGAAFGARGCLMLVPGLADAVLAQHWVLGSLDGLRGTFGSGLGVLLGEGC